MGSAILQFFTVEEILTRLAEKRLTGCFHVFTPKESSNVFLKDGEIVAATQGALEGEEVLLHILALKDTRYLLELDAVPPESTKPLKLNLAEFLTKRKTGVLGSDRLPAPPDNGTRPAAAPAHPVISIAAKGQSTGKISSTTDVKLTTPPSVTLTATKTFTPSGEVRAAQEQALINKHKLILVSAENPDLRFMITRISSLVGRNPACDITIPHASISRQHCLFQLTDRGLHVKDLDTTNGTKVNGIALKEGYVNVGDKLMIGHLPFFLKQL